MPWLVVYDARPGSWAPDFASGQPLPFPRRSPPGPPLSLSEIVATLRQPICTITIFLLPSVEVTKTMIVVFGLKRVTEKYACANLLVLPRLRTLCSFG